MQAGRSETLLSDAEKLAVELDWTAICREIVEAIKPIFAGRPSYEDRREEVGRGAGGDNTLAIDAAAEDAVFVVLERVATGGAAFNVVSEERGTVDFGGPSVRVVVDPIDGSLNAKRAGLSYSLSIGVAIGDTMDGVFYGFVYDFGSGEEWTATLGGGAFRDGIRLDPSAAGNGLEIVGLEATKPARIKPELIAAFADDVQRIRSIGSIALTLCQVAAARFDGMVSLRACRSVDAAAGQLIVREAGGDVIFGDPRSPLSAPLDLIAHVSVAAARDRARTLRLLAALDA